MESGRVRQNGKTVAQTTAQDASKTADDHLDTDIEQKRRFRSPGFSRFKVEWKPEDGAILTRSTEMAERRLIAEFPDAYRVLNAIYDLIREPVMVSGVPMRDGNGFVVWKRDEYGSFNENWDKLTRGERENLLFTITTNLVDWEQRAQDLWGEAMFAKAIWEESYSIGFDEPMSGTIGDREAKGRKDSAEERYRAVYLTMLSRKADSLVKAMDRIAQRLRDSLYAR